MNTTLIIGFLVGALLVIAFQFFVLELVYDAGYDEGYGKGLADSRKEVTE